MHVQYCAVSHSVGGVKKHALELQLTSYCKALYIDTFDSQRITENIGVA